MDTWKPYIYFHFKLPEPTFMSKGGRKAGGIVGWKTRITKNRTWHDYYEKRWFRTYTVTEEFRFWKRGKGTGSIGFQSYRIERDENTGQYKFHAVGKPVKTLDTAKDFVAVLTRLEVT
jgi:hypothetical protein